MGALGGRRGLYSKWEALGSLQQDCRFFKIPFFPPIQLLRSANLKKPSQLRNALFTYSLKISQYLKRLAPSPGWPQTSPTHLPRSPSSREAPEACRVVECQGRGGLAGRGKAKCLPPEPGPLRVWTGSST